MSSLRFDPSTSDWVIFAPSRKLRPRENEPKAAPATTEPPAANCPFCCGNEAFTPPEIYSIPGEPGSPCRWRVRVVPNKFPALRIEEDPGRIIEDAHFHSMGGCGAHEVIVESPVHQRLLVQQPVEQIECVLRAVQWRHQDLMRDPRFQTVVIFKNHGVEAGTSLVHPHWQLIATAVVPRMLRLKHFEAAAYYDRTGKSLYQVMVEEEIAAAKRVVARNERFVSFMPYASHSPFEIWILPLAPQSSFTLASDDDLRSLAAILKDVLLKLHTGLQNPAFNLTIDDVPRGDEDKAYFVWHLRIIPRLTTAAGFELGSGMSINTVLPEEATAFLTEVPVAVIQ